MWYFGTNFREKKLTIVVYKRGKMIHFIHAGDYTLV